MIAACTRLLMVALRWQIKPHPASTGMVLESQNEGVTLPAEWAEQGTIFCPAAGKFARTLIENWLLQTDSHKSQVSKTCSQISLVAAHEQAGNDLSTVTHTLIC